MLDSGFITTTIAEANDDVDLSTSSSTSYHRRRTQRCLPWREPDGQLLPLAEAGAGAATGGGGGGGARGVIGNGKKKARV